MTGRIAALAVVLATTLTLGGCGQSAPNEEDRSAVAVEHMATGTLNAFDAAAGTVNITHGPVPSASWPEMTMTFKLADPGAAAGLKLGGRVDFHFKIESGMDATVTFIAPLD